MTPLYHRIIAHAEKPIGRVSLDVERPLLAHQVWDPTPWVITIRSPYPGSSSASFKDGDVDRLTHIHWLSEAIGKESWPIHGKPGDWHFGGATVDGETWLGFRTEEMMRQFMAFFPQSIIAERTTADAAMPANQELTRPAGTDARTTQEPVAGSASSDVVGQTESRETK